MSRRLDSSSVRVPAPPRPGWAPRPPSAATAYPARGPAPPPRPHPIRRLVASPLACRPAHLATSPGRIGSRLTEARAPHPRWHPLASFGPIASSVPHPLPAGPAPWPRRTSAGLLPSSLNPDRSPLCPTPSGRGLLPSIRSVPHPRGGSPGTEWSQMEPKKKFFFTLVPPPRLPDDPSRPRWRFGRAQGGGGTDSLARFPYADWTDSSRISTVTFRDNRQTVMTTHREDDSANRLRRIASRPNGVAVCSFAYDHQGRRRSKTVSNWMTGHWSLITEHRFLSAGWNLLAVLATDLQPVTSFTWGLDASGTEQGAGVGVGLFQRMNLRISMLTRICCGLVAMVICGCGGGRAATPLATVGMGLPAARCRVGTRLSGSRTGPRVALALPSFDLLGRPPDLHPHHQRPTGRRAVRHLRL